MNEALLKATLKVILDGQAILYATIMTQKNMDAEDVYKLYGEFVKEYKAETAKLILEAMNAVQDDTSSEATT